MSGVPSTLPRVLRGAAGRPLTRVQHEEVFAHPAPTGALLDELDAAGLTGRGGAAFPTARKARLIREQRSHAKFVVLNAMEGEPASHKDRTLLGANPHLVLDGAELLASAIGAQHVAVCVARDNQAAVIAVQRALHERERRGARGANFELHTPPWRYVAGEESALVHWLNDHQSLPQYRPHRPSVLRIGPSAALVDNAETCAHVGLIGRYGADWFRAVGTGAEPGSTLVSLTGALNRPTVLEVALGTPLRSILAAAGADTSPRAVLLGGYGGAWLDGAHVDTPYANESLQPLGASVGAGVIMVLPRQGCGVVETQRIARWMANESARQCGPCAFGLPAMAEDLAHLTHGSRDPRAALQRLIERTRAIDGRGACRHPDGVVRLVRSALAVFAEDVENHVRGQHCGASRSGTHYAPVPSLEPEAALVWE